MEQTESKAHNYQKKKQNPNITYNIINQLKFNEKEYFYKAHNLEYS